MLMLDIRVFQGPPNEFTISSVIRLAGQQHDSESLAFRFFLTVRDGFLMGVLGCFHQQKQLKDRIDHVLKLLWTRTALPSGSMSMLRLVLWGWDQPTEIGESTGYPHY